VRRRRAVLDAPGDVEERSEHQRRQHEQQKETRERKSEHVRSVAEAATNLGPEVVEIVRAAKVER
jgi:hypothetical protein